MSDETAASSLSRRLADLSASMTQITLTTQRSLERIRRLASEANDAEAANEDDADDLAIRGGAAPIPDAIATLRLARAALLDDANALRGEAPLSRAVTAASTTTAEQQTEVTGSAWDLENQNWPQERLSLLEERKTLKRELKDTLAQLDRQLAKATQQRRGKADDSQPAAADAPSV